MKVTKQNMRWTNEPEKWKQQDEDIKMTCPMEVDFWRNTLHGFIKDVRVLFDVMCMAMPVAATAPLLLSLFAIFVFYFSQHCPSIISFFGVTIPSPMKKLLGCTLLLDVC